MKTKKAELGDIILIDGAEHVVIETAMQGGGMNFDGPYPDGWHVVASRLRPGRVFDEGAPRVDFYMNGFFCNMREEVEVVGKMRRTFA